jgi:hypothetical protein
MILRKRLREKGDGGTVIFDEKASCFLNNLACNIPTPLPSRGFFDRATEQGANQRCHVSYQYFYHLY